MKTMILIEVDHRTDIPALGEMIAGRAYTISGVTNAEFVKDFAKIPVLEPEQLQAMGFSMDEIALGSHDVERS